MGLGISIGHLAWLVEDESDPESIDWGRQRFGTINHILAEHGYLQHHEPEALPEIESRCRLSGMPYSWIHYLRRAVAYSRRAPERFLPVAEGEDPTDDFWLDLELSEYLESHIICHSDSEGFYVPIDFPKPLFDEAVSGGALGSSQQAMKELIQVAPLLGISVENDSLPDAVVDTINSEESGPLYTERQVWLQLFELFRLSIEHKTAVVFG